MTHKPGKQKNCPCSSLSVALRRAGPISHLGSTSRDDLGKEDSREPKLKT